jgi:tetratricopeptide (TPR) repeat protein
MPARILCLVLTLAVCGCASSSGGKSGGWFGWFGGKPEEATLGPDGKPVDPNRKLLSLAQLAERKGQKAEAQSLYKQAIEKDPKNSLSYRRLGVMCAKDGKVDEAFEYLAKAEALSPQDAGLLSDMGYVYYLAHRLPEAEKYLRRAMDLEPTHLQYSNNLALVVGAMGRDQECLALFRRSGQRTQADVNLAFVLAQRGEYQRALATYDQALSDDRTLRPAADAMIELAKYTQGRGPTEPPGELTVAPGRSYPGPYASPAPGGWGPAMPASAPAGYQTAQQQQQWPPQQWPPQPAGAYAVNPAWPTASAGNMPAAAPTTAGYPYSPYPATQPTAPPAGWYGPPAQQVAPAAYWSEGPPQPSYPAGPSSSRAATTPMMR